MITNFTDFLNENFEFDPYSTFDYINSKCFDNKLKKIPIEFVTNKRAKMFVDGVKITTYKPYSKTMRVDRLCISKNFHFSKQQFIDCLTHEMIHVYFLQNNIEDFGGQHGVKFKKEMKRINDLNIGIKVGLFDDENIKSVGIKDELKNKLINRTFYIYLQKQLSSTGKEHYNLTPFSNKESLLEFWERKTKNLEYMLRMIDWKDSIFDICMGETNLSDVGHFPISRMMKTAKLFIIDKDKYNNIKSNTRIYEEKQLKNKTNL